MALCGAILAGGRATRMGEPKHAVRLGDGRTMLECVADALRRVCDVLAVVGLHEPEHALAVRQRFPNAALIHDTRPGDGPLGGIEALLATGLSDGYIVCSCDMPMLSPEIMEALAAQRGNESAVLHIHGEEQWRPLPCYVSARVLRTASQLLRDDERSVRALHSVLDAKVIEAPASWADALMDVNTPSDLDSANALLASRPARRADARSETEIVTMPQRKHHGRPSP